MTKQDLQCAECGAVMSADFYSADPARRRYFAILREAYVNLRPPWSEMFRDVEQLRKHCLIKVGWCDTTTIVLGSKQAALDVATLVPRLDRYAVAVIAGGNVVTVYVARSQTRRAQPKAQFLEVSRKVYDILSDMLGTSLEDIERVA